jgi:hypothetical protein
MIFKRYKKILAGDSLMGLVVVSGLLPGLGLLLVMIPYHLH